MCGGHGRGGGHGKAHLQLCMADHALTQDAEQHGRRGPRPCAPSVRWLHIYREEILVGEWVQLQEVELAFEVSNVTAHRRACHTPPVAHTRVDHNGVGHNGTHEAYVLELADALSVHSMLLLSDGVIFTPQMLNHAQPRKQTAGCVVEEAIESPHVIIYRALNFSAQQRQVHDQQIPAASLCTRGGVARSVVE